MHQASFVTSDGFLHFNSGARYDTKSFVELDVLHGKLTTSRATAIALDTKEYQIAVEELKGYCFSDGYDKEASDAAFRAIVQENENLWNQFHQHFKNIHATRDNPETILNTTYKEWTEVVSRLEGIEQQVPTLTVDSWQGTAANSYRAELPKRQEEVKQLKTLATASRNGLEAVAELQAAILGALANSMKLFSQRIENYISNNPVNEEWLRNHFKNSYWDFKPNNQAQYSFKFYSRTRTLSAYFQQMARDAGLRLDNQTKGDWVPSSEEIKKYFESSLSAATAGRDADDYQGRDFDPTTMSVDVPTQEGANLEH